MYIPIVSETCIIIKLISKIVLLIMLVLNLFFRGDERIKNYFSKHKICAKITLALTIIGFVSVLCDVL